MTHDELIRTERLAQQMVNQTKVWIDSYQKYHLDEVTTVLAEVRHAGAFLCDPDLSPALRCEVVERLIKGLFTVPTSKVQA